MGRIRLALLPVCLAFLTGCALAAGSMPGPPPGGCVAPGEWGAPTAGGTEPLPADQALARLAGAQVVLLGETHEDAEHHRWQLHTIAGLYALRPRLLLGFEMFPRRVQAVLDDWTAGRLTEAELLLRTDWSKVWGVDPQLYLPIFHFARMHRIPMLALNVERSLVRKVGEQGWAAVPEAEREGVGSPAPATTAYVSRLYPVFLAHDSPAGAPAGAPQPPTPAELADPIFRRFVEAMQVWDRAMAQEIADRLREEPSPLVVAIMGSGHVLHGDGVAYQLRALQVTRIAAAVPWGASDGCAGPGAGAADLVFGIQASPQPTVAERPRLGVAIEEGAGGVGIRDVTPGSIAEAAGLRRGDVILRVAGMAVESTESVIAAVRRQAPGTWLPLTVKRGDETLEVVARFPPRP